jgi:hypothetical protein
MASSPLACSGDMNSGEPVTVPPSQLGVGGGFHRRLARPKSSNLMTSYTRRDTQMLAA